MLTNIKSSFYDCDQIREKGVIEEFLYETNVPMEYQTPIEDPGLDFEIKEVRFLDVREYDDSFCSGGSYSGNTDQDVLQSAQTISQKCKSIDEKQIFEIVKSSNVNLQEWLSKKESVTDMSTETFLDQILVKADPKVGSISGKSKVENTNYVCSICREVSENDEELDRHARIQHNAYKCPFCCKIFIQRYIYKKHLYVHTDKRVYCCSLCPLTFKRECDLCSHVKRTHAKTKSTIYQCDKCDYRARTRYAIKVHILAHDSRHLYSCDECGKGFNSKIDLQTHKNNHIGFKPYQCDICGNSFTRGTYLKQHRAMVHENPRSFKCAVCDRCFSLKATIKNHLKVHMGESKNFTCDICGRSVSSKKALINHQRIHAGDKRFACDVCHKTYVTKLQVKRHAYIHTGLKPYKCDTCQKSLATSSSLIKHMQTHWHTRIVYSCPSCNKTYVSKYKLNSHIINNHH